MNDIEHLLTPPWTMVPLVHQETHLFPTPTMDALADFFDQTAQNLIDASMGGFTSLVRAMHQGKTNLNWLHIGDSTSAQTWNYPYRVLAEIIAPAFPHLRITYTPWDQTTGWLAPIEIQNPGGSTPPGLHLRNLSVAGKNLAYVQGDWRWDAAFRDDPVAISIAHGFNEPSTGRDTYRSRMLGLVEAIRERQPKAEVLIIGQNPHRTDETNTIRAGEYSRVAQWLGVGFCDLTTPFLTHPDMASLYPSGDPVHPNGAGHTIMRDVLARQFTLNAYGDTRPQGVSGLATFKPTIFPAGLFPSWDGTGLPAGASKTSNLTLSKNTTDYETNGFSVQAASTAASQYINIAATVGPRFQKRTVTVAARIKDVTGYGSYAEVADGVTSVNGAGNDEDAANGWRWSVAQMKVAPTATYLSAAVRVPSGVTVRIDRIITCLGPIPHDALS